MAERSDAGGPRRAAEALVPAPGAWDGPFYGDVGVLVTDGARVECHLCARWFHLLGSHVRQAHGLSPAAYRALTGLNAQTALAGPVLRARRRELAEATLAPYRARVAEVARAQTPEARAARMRGRTLRPEARLARATDPDHERRVSERARRAWTTRRERYPETAGGGRPEAVRSFADPRAASRAGLAVRRQRLRDPAYREAFRRRVSEAKGGRVAVVCVVCGGAFRVPPSWVAHGQARLCGPACRARWRLGRRTGPGGLPFEAAAARLRDLEATAPGALDRALPAPGAAVVRLAYGLGGAAPLALRAVAARAGLPLGRVRRLVAGPEVARLLGARAPAGREAPDAHAPVRRARAAPARTAGT